MSNCHEKKTEIIACPVRTGAKRFKKTPALLSQGTTISYMEFDVLVSTVVAQLEKEGISSGERIATLAWNSWEHVILFFALLRLGAVACPISPRFPEQVIQSILQKLDCTTLLYGKGLYAGLGTQIPHFKAIDTLFQNAQASPCLHTPDETNKLEIDLNRPATIVLTSGTTSVPKAVLHSYGNHYYNALGANQNVPIRPGQRWLLSLPLFHVGGLGILFRMVLEGGTVVIPPAKHPLMDCLKEYNITHLSLVATQLYRLLEDGLSGAVTKQLQAVLVGGGPVPFSLIDRALEAGVPIHTTYGLTEMASQVTATWPNAHLENLATSGSILPYRDMTFKEKEIYVKGKTLFQGYVEGIEIMRPFDNEGWYRTGDLGQLDRHGHLTLLGRKDNLFISGGENVCPEEIEKCLCALPQITQAVVVPVENLEFGFRPVAFIQTLQNLPIEPNPMVAHLEKHLPRFKIPEAFYPWPEDPDNGSLKPNRQFFIQKAKTLHEKN